MAKQCRFQHVRSLSRGPIVLCVNADCQRTAAEVLADEDAPAECRAAAERGAPEPPSRTRPSFGGHHRGLVDGG